MRKRMIEKGTKYERMRDKKRKEATEDRQTHRKEGEMGGKKGTLDETKEERRAQIKPKGIKKEMKEERQK